MKMIDFNAYRKKYLEKIPGKRRIRVLLIAESPPAQDEDVPAFFYYDEDDLRRVDRGSLFGEVMAGLYPMEWKRYQWIGSPVGNNKRIMLTRFSNDGLYLIDATDEPLQGLSLAWKTEKLESVKIGRTLTKHIASLAGGRHLWPNTRIYITSCLVYDKLYESLRNESFSAGGMTFNLKNMLSDRRIPMPFGSNDSAQRFRSFMGCLREIIAILNTQRQHP
jgi:hypothetical protein